MKLRNKKTGEMVIFGEGVVDLNQIGCKNVGEMIEAGWEDYEEPKEYYYYIDDGGIISIDQSLSTMLNMRKSFGNYFETREEAEKAVEKLKAWKRLKDKGFRFNGVEVFSEGLLEIDGVLSTLEGIDNVERLKIIDDLDLLFSGDEE